MKKIAAALAASLLAGCAGGAHSALVPAHGPQGSAAHRVSVSIAIAIPRGTASAKHRPAYISPSTQAAVVDVTQPGSPTARTVVACGGSQCVGTVPATVGLDTFAIGLNDKPDGSGNTLASGQTTATVVEGQANAVSVTFNGVVASLKVAFDKPNPPVNATTTVSVLVSALDADGNTIVGPGTYDNPIVVTDGDTSGATTMAPASLTQPSDPAPTLTYNGTWIGGDSASAPITASVPANPAVKPFTGALVPLPQVVEYTIPTAGAQPIDLAKGSDGAIWFTEQYGHKIGRVTTSGAFTEYAVPGSSSPYSNPMPWAITAGGDGNLWFSDVATYDEAIESITTGGTVTRHSIATPNHTHGVDSMVWGADGNLWATDNQNNQILRYAPAGGSQTAYAIPHPQANAQQITAGPDGALWFTEHDGGNIGRLTTSGTITEYPSASPAGATSWPLGITSGPDGALWYIDGWTGVIGHMTTAGVGFEFTRDFGHNASGTGIITGPDGAVWYGTGFGTFGRISTKGTVTTFPIAAIQARGGNTGKFAIGGDGNMWYVDTYGNVVGKIVL